MKEEEGCPMPKGTEILSMTLRSLRSLASPSAWSYNPSGCKFKITKQGRINRFFQRENLIQFDKKVNYEFNQERDFDDYKFEACRSFLEDIAIFRIS